MGNWPSNVQVFRWIIFREAKRTPLCETELTNRPDFRFASCGRKEQSHALSASGLGKSQMGF
jgi:hypothetical protein